MNTITAISALLGTLIPILVAYISTRHNFRKHPRQEFSEDIESAREFEKILESNESHLIKDKVTQKFILRKNINFLEGKYFYSYVDMELWVHRYLEVRNFIKLEYDDQNYIVELKPKNKISEGIWYLFLYIFYACIAILPLVFINFYINLWETSWVEKNYLNLFNMIIWPIISICFAFINLYKADKTWEAKCFLYEIKKEGIKF